MNKDKPFLKDEEMKRVLKNHLELDPRSKKRIADHLFAKLKRKKDSSGGVSHRFWRRFAFAASAGVAAVLIFLLGYERMRTPEIGTVMECWNDCKMIRKSQTFTRINIGDRLKIGDLLITGSEAGMRIRTGDGSIVSIGNNSELECTAPRGRGRSTFDLHRGSILAKVAHDSKRLFSVKTPYALLKVLGTEFEAKVVGDPSQFKKEKDKMKPSIIRNTAAYMALTVLTGTVAVSPVTASETVVKSGYTADISASGQVTVDAVKAKSFIDSIIKSNYEEGVNIWLRSLVREGLVSSLYRFDYGTGRIRKAADFVGFVHVEAQFNGGALLSLDGLLVNGFESLDGNSGCPILANTRLMMVVADGAMLELGMLTKYRPLYPVLSPDGSRLAFIGGDEDKGLKYGLYVLDIRTLTAKLLFPGGGADNSRMVAGFLQNPDFLQSRICFQS